MKKCIVFLFGILPFISFTQKNECIHTLKGKVLDKSSQKAIPFSSVQLMELKSYIQTDSLGRFVFNDLCNGSYTLLFYHNENEKPLEKKIYLATDTTIIINIESCFHSIEEVIVTGHQIKKQEIETLQKNTLSGADLDLLRGTSLSESLKAITGVNTIQTGPTISKPMIHGLYGNRVLILNNGVRLEGQNWGADHAPEIDPFVGSKLSVIKGASSIRYGMEAIAGVVLVEPKDLPKEKTLQGELNLVGMSNGKSGTVSSYIEGAFDKKLSGLNWRIQGTIKDGGSYKTPTYYLTNTAVKENNYSASINYSRKNFNLQTYYSSFKSTLGIYSGSNVGNLNDLNLLFNSASPIVPSIFSYQIKRGYQDIHHQLIKLKGEYQFKRLGKLIYTYGRQENKRLEFGEDLSYNQQIVDQNIPDAYFKLVTNTSDLILEHKSIGHLSGSIGLNFGTQGNVFQGLDYRALIPNFRNYSGGAFILEKIHLGKWLIEAGIRYDYKWMKTYTMDYIIQIPYSTVLSWGNYSGTVGSIYRFNTKNSINLSAGIGWRPPAPIELFAYGIHQSAASFEIGDSTLRSEKSYNLQTYYTHTGKRFYLEVGAYFNQFKDYIYLNPASQPVTTVAGTYPAFQYKQADVYYTGIDLNVSYDIIPSLEIISKTSIVYAYNQTIHDYLIYVPANRFNNSIKYTLNKFWKFSTPFLQVSSLIVSKQSRVPFNVDYVAPPKGYALFNIDFGFSIPVKKQSVFVSLSVNNVFNSEYRDYLNRFRYYSNELGRNFTFRIKIPFALIQAKKAE